jgi:N-acetylated-alpha-linked acidic dipeptidase
MPLPIAAVVACLAAFHVAAAAPSAAPRADAAALTDAVNAVADARSLSAFHEALASEPHVAGTPGDARQVERLTKAFREMGLEVEVHRFHPYLARPVAARLEIVGEEAPEGARRGVLALDLRERNLLEDPSTAHPDLTWGWNAYSGSGDVTAGVVYANYGTRADFARLKELGIDVKGKIVLARYGGNFRGYKAKFAEEAGAAGLLIYTDPADSGFVKGPTWPDGGWSNDTCIQRGSIVTLPYPGDPLTPGVEATRDAARADPSKVDLPTIPVQPIGYAAAERIFARMKGDEVRDDSWKGGVRQTYRYDGGSALQVRLEVRQERFVGETANVIATLPGATRPDEMVIVGCHHDAWCFGAADPLAGTMVLLESARSFADAARKGIRPDRTIVFAAWGAEEFGIIGSVEWVESRREALERNAVAYVNLDMASMGERFGASASPSLRPSIERAIARTSSPFTGGSLYEAWVANAKAPSAGASFGDMGGGSDHVGFWCHAGVPSCSVGGSGAPGSSYHSNYDTVAWYRRTVGEDYRSALMVTRACNAVTAEFANDPRVPVSVGAMLRDVVRLVRAADEARTKAALATSLAPLVERATALQARAERVDRALAAGGPPDPNADALLRRCTAAWIDDAGLPHRPWFRNRYAATDRYSGYAASLLPLIAEAIEDRDDAALARAVAEYEAILARIDEALRQLEG